MAELVQRLEQHVDKLGSEHEPSFLRGAEQILAGMHEAGEGRDLEQAGGALERMQRAEQLVHRRRGARVALERQQAAPGLVEQVARLGDELLQQRVREAAHDAGPARIRAKPPSVSGRTGFTRNRLAPEAKPRSASSGARSVVTMMAGTAARTGCARASCRKV